jgi:hypothetical protein
MVCLQAERVPSPVLGSTPVSTHDVAVGFSCPEALDPFRLPAVFPAALKMNSGLRATAPELPGSQQYYPPQELSTNP